jgi:flagellar biosynthesis protein FliP
MFIAILYVVSILAVSILAWLLRQRITHHLPSKRVMNNFGIVALVVLLLVLAILPDILVLLTTINLMPHSLKIVLGLAAAALICVGCSKRAEPPKQPAIQWTAPDTGYHAETRPEIHKEGQ